MNITFGDADSLRKTWNEAVKVSNNGFGILPQAVLVRKRIRGLAHAIANEENISLKMLESLPKERKLKKHARYSFFLLVIAISQLDEEEATELFSIAFSLKR